MSFDIISKPAYNQALEYLQSKGFKFEIEENPPYYTLKLTAPNGEIHIQKCEHNAGYSPTLLIDFLRKQGVKSEDEIKEFIACINVIVDGVIPRKLRFSVDDFTIIPLESDGLAVNPAMCYIKHGGKAIIGELTYIHSVIQRERKGELEEFKAFIPYLVYAICINKAIVKRSLQPLFKVKTLDVEGFPPIRLVWESRSLSPLKTVMTYETIQDFLRGVKAPTFRELFEIAVENIKRYVDFWWDKRLYSLCAVYSIATYFADFFSAFPFLYFYGVSGTGKSRAGRTVTYLSRRGFEITDPTVSPIFRTAEAFKPTIFFDEGVMGREIWRLVRAGFKKQSYVPRISKIKDNQFTLTLFEPYTPYVFASTETPEELGGGEADITRCITVTMNFGKDPSGRDPEATDFIDFREKMYLARLTRSNEVETAIEELKKLPFKLSGREREVWFPLLVIAKLIGEEVFNEILSIAVELFESKKLELYKNERLIIEAIEQIGGENGVYEFYAKDLYPQLKIILVEERGELTEKQFEKYWSTRKIGRLLKRMNIKGKMYSGIKRYILSSEELEKLKEKYLGVFGGFGVLSSEHIHNQKNTPNHDETSSKTMKNGVFLEQRLIPQTNPPNTPNPPSHDNLSSADGVFSKIKGKNTPENTPQNCYSCVHCSGTFCLKHGYYVTPTTPTCKDYARKMRST